MIEQFNFYFWHSLNDLRVNGRRTFFALLCIAAGVAAVVSLQTVAVMIGDTLTNNLQSSNRGDIQVNLDQGFGDDENQVAMEQGATDGVLEVAEANGLFNNPEQKNYILGTAGLAKIQAWFEANYPGEVELTYPYQIGDFSSIFTGGVGTSVSNTAGDAASQVTPVLIDPKVYPFYSEVKSLDGTLLADLFTAPTDIVVDEKVAETLGVKVGDTLRVNGVDTDFTLRGIVPTHAEVTDPGSGLLTALFGFYYLNRAAIQYFPDVAPQTNKLYLKVTDATRVTEINAAFLKQYPYFSTTTVDTLRVDNQKLSDQINQLVTVVGLVSLLLGSIGIINTMQVIVRRRTVEV
ncbi:MAG TPA: ABC transporter permease, partial [Phototrophicaceae bacterium]|nr:ABC transporter permease [Phototrophicaceae bacterium]